MQDDAQAPPTPQEQTSSRRRTARTYPEVDPNPQGVSYDRRSGFIGPLLLMPTAFMSPALSVVGLGQEWVAR
ncbi:hypothetical protein RA2_01963 [Roseovarius sp. A-2]|nr:hypothetical protein RA2_01963 [Roseovarius sp. A-2]